MSGRFCKHCGNPYTDAAARFCKNCGRARYSNPGDSKWVPERRKLSRHSLPVVIKWAVFHARVRAAIHSLARGVATVEEDIAAFLRHLAEERQARQLNPVVAETAPAKVNLDVQSPAMHRESTGHPTLPMAAATILIIIALFLRWGDVAFARANYIEIITYAFRSLSGLGGYMRGDYQLVAWAFLAYLCIPGFLAANSLFLWTIRSSRWIQRQCLSIGVLGVAWCVLSYVGLAGLGQSLRFPVPALLGTGFFAFSAGSLLFVGSGIFSIPDQKV